MIRKLSFSSYVLLGIVLFGSILRFYNLMWDNGLFLHPDERLFINASNLSLPHSFTQFLSPNSPLNPHMFYYGSFLLYLYKLASLISPFSLLVTSRIISALCSSLTITFVFLIAKKLFSPKVGILSALIFACSIGSIQYAHFNTTESMLIFLISSITLTDILTIQKKDPRLLIVSLLLVGIAAATKITGAIFSISPIIASLLLLKERFTLSHILFWFFFGSVCAGLIFFFLSPYQLIDLQSFLVQTTYMQSVTYGTVKPPFVLIYQNTLPYLYQLLHIFPFYLGFLSYPLSIIGLFLLLKEFMKSWRKYTTLLFLFVFPLLYFGWSGSWYAKFARYYVLLLPFMAIWAGFTLSKIKKIYVFVLGLLIIGNAMLFMQIYLSDNTRIVASQWMNNNIPPNAIIATEHWDDALPITLKNINTTFRHKTLFVYNPENTQKIGDLAQTIAQSDYIVLSSRRVYVSILQNKQLYPITNTFYKKLFAGSLGYKHVYSISRYPFFFSDDYADETFQSYDHPPVIIYQNQKYLSKERILSLITTE